LSGRTVRKWTLVQVLDHPDPDAANEQAIADIEGGATGLSLRFAGAPSAGRFGLAPTAEAIRLALEGIDLASIQVRLEPHARAPQEALWLSELIARNGIAPERAAVVPGLDPIAMLAFQGSNAEPDFRDYVASFCRLRAGSLGGPLAVLDARIYHDAGATEAQELAALLAAAVWWLRALEEAGFAPPESVPYFGACLAVDNDQFLSIAKLRAAQLLWASLQELCGSPPTRLSIHAETSRRMMTRADPTTNLLRTTIAALAACVGGADSIAVVPHDAALRLPDRGARALARNMQHLLMEEAHLDAVGDPAAGSGALEALSDGLAEHAWAEFQTIEREGGIVASLRSGTFQTRIAAARGALQANLASGAIQLVGSTIHRSPHEAALVATDDASFAAAAGLAPLRLEEMARPPA
jgi:methylmalonyl-CoA mutase